MTLLRWRPGQSRSPLIVGLLLLTMGLTAALAYQAQDAVRSHKKTAQRVLDDYVNLAASAYVRRLSWELEDYAYEPALQALGGGRRAPGARDRDAGVPAPAPVKVWVEDTELAIDLVRFNFKLGLDGPASSAARTLITRGQTPTPALRDWLVDTLRIHARTHYQPGWSWGSVTGVVDGIDHTIVYQVERDSLGTPLAAAGFAADPAGMKVYFDYSLNVAPLIPAALTGGVVQDSLVSMSVIAPSGHAVFRSERQYDSPLTAVDSLGARFGHWIARASLHPGAAGAIVIEGPPRSQLPLLVGLFIVTMGLVTAALLQLRREFELARLRSDFVASVSHELRTPLAQIRLFAETLRLGRVRSEEEHQRSLEIIDQEARRLTHLVENVLHFSRAERRAVNLSLELTDLTALVRAVVEGFAPLAAAREVKLVQELEPGVMASVDPGAVRQMLINLLDNAVKYGPSGQTVTVGMRLAERAAEIRVADQGPGIEPGDRTRIWERFFRLKRETKTAVAGAGIGLAVVRELASLHGGKAWVEDAPGGGARFVIELPEAWRAVEDRA